MARAAAPPLHCVGRRRRGRRRRGGGPARASLGRAVRDLRGAAGVPAAAQCAVDGAAAVVGSRAHGGALRSRASRRRQVSTPNPHLAPTAPARRDRSSCARNRRPRSPTRPCTGPRARLTARRARSPPADSSGRAAYGGGRPEVLRISFAAPFSHAPRVLATLRLPGAHDLQAPPPLSY